MLRWYHDAPLIMGEDLSYIIHTVSVTHLAALIYVQFATSSHFDIESYRLTSYVIYYLWKVTEIK